MDTLDSLEMSADRKWYFIIKAHMESLKLPTTPGDSPGVGPLKQGLLALQRMPWIHGSVPADGIALLGK